jgi:hypothetical protein
MLRVDENKIFRKIIELKIDDVRGSWWRLLELVAIVE